jgi:hypothetical protein
MRSGRRRLIHGNGVAFTVQLTRSRLTVDVFRNPSSPREKALWEPSPSFLHPAGLWPVKKGRHTYHIRRGVSKLSRMASSRIRIWDEPDVLHISTTADATRCYSANFRDRTLDRGLRFLSGSRAGFWFRFDISDRAPRVGNHRTYFVLTNSTLISIFTMSPTTASPVLSVLFRSVPSLCD